MSRSRPASPVPSDSGDEFSESESEGPPSPILFHDPEDPSIASSSRPKVGSFHPPHHPHLQQQHNAPNVQDIVPIALRSLHLPAPENQEESLSHILKLIEHFCASRGEHIELWLQEVESRGLRTIKYSRVDVHQTLTMLYRVLERLEKGEFLCLFNPASSYIDKINPEFLPSKVVVRGKGKGRQSLLVELSHRLLPFLFKKLDLILEKEVYRDALVKPHVKLTANVFHDSITRISSTFAQLGPVREEEAKRWMTHMGSFYEQNAHKIGDSLLRWFLIVSSEKVRTGEKLPIPDTLLQGTVETPQNVGPTDECFVFAFRPVPHHSHSLGRISIRQARRIGFVGRDSSEGGYDF